MAGKIRVAHVIPRYYPVFGGAETQCRLLVKHLPATGEVEVPFLLTGRVEQHYLKTEMIDEVQVYRLGVPGFGRWQWYWFYLLSSLFLIRHRKAFDVIHCHATSTMGLAMTVTGRLLRKPVVLKLSTNGELLVGLGESAGNHSANRFRASLRRKMAGYLARRATIVALNQEGAREVERAAGGRSITIPNGIDVTQYCPLDPDQRTALRATYGFSADDIVLLFVGRFVARKGIDVLLPAFELIQSEVRCDRLHLCLAGGGDLQEDAVSVVGDLYLDGSQKRVHVLPPRIPAVEYYQLADMFVSPSRQEGLPNVVLEALAIGLPCVLSDIEPHIELRKTNPEADIRLFATDEAEQLACSVCAGLESLDPSALLGTGQARLSADFHIDTVASAYSKLYIRLTTNLPLRE